MPLPQLSSHREAKDPVLTLPLAPSIMLENARPGYQTSHLTPETVAQQPKGQPSSRMPPAPHAAWGVLRIRAQHAELQGADQRKARQAGSEG